MRAKKAAEEKAAREKAERDAKYQWGLREKMERAWKAALESAKRAREAAAREKDDWMRRIRELQLKCR
jgi:hypothetical protein